MRDEMALPALLFVRTGRQWAEQDRHLLAAFDGLTSGLVTAAPARNAETALSDADRGAEVRYVPEQGLAGILMRLRSLGSLDTSRDLVVISDQVFGPVGSIDELMAGEDSGVVLTLVGSDGRQDATEDMTLPTAEPAGPLAMELTWLRIPRGLLGTERFWEATRRATDLAEAELGWLDLAGFTRTLEAEGVAVRPVFDGPNDLFARDLEFYLHEGIPLLPWAIFTSNPLVLERWAIVPRYAYDYTSRSQYPSRLFWSRILSSCPPQTWYTNLSLLDILPNTAPRGFVNEMKTAVIAHVFYPEMLAQILKYAGNVPDPVELFVTTNTEEKRQELESILKGQDRLATWQVRVVTTNRGRDVSALLVDCEDILRDPKFDVILKLHSKRSVQDPSSVSAWFRDHLFKNLLGSPGYVKHILKRFQDEPELGIIMPPVIHMGVPTMGNGWTLNKGPAEQLAKRLKVDIPFDTFTPLSPYGSMFYARREALLPLVDAGFRPEEFPDADGYRDGSLAHVIERLFSYVVFSQGYYARCVQQKELAEISSVALQYKYDQVSHYLFPFATRQIKLLGGGDTAPSDAQVRFLIRRQLKTRYPRTGAAAASAEAFVKRTVGGMKRRLGRS
ncbi:MAG: rhamnan synthesis F family protein [Scrofimicrobium sp.]